MRPQLSLTDMGRAAKPSKRRARQHKSEKAPELGAASFHCPACGIGFEVKWLDIFALQEMTHGYIGFSIEEDYIACPKCGQNANVVGRW